MVVKIDDKNDKAIQLLLSKAEGQGYITLDDMMEVFPEVEENLEELDDLFIYLSEEGIQVLYGDEKKEAEEPLEEEDKEPEAPEEPPVDMSFDLSEIASDDTISLYLKEMARVPLLTAEQEIMLARQFEEGRNARRELAQKDGPSEEERDRLCALIDRGEGARAHLIRANTRLVVSIAKRYLG